jgi:hypothetical protein
MQFLIEIEYNEDEFSGTDVSSALVDVELELPGGKRVYISAACLSETVEDTVTVQVGVACCNASGEPDLFVTKVVLPKSDYDNGAHYRIAERRADAEDYQEPMITFDESDPLGRVVFQRAQS